MNNIEAIEKIYAATELLRENVHQFSLSVFRFKITRDTAAYYAYKAKLSELEDSFERLQQSTVDVQMEQEAISGQFQDEMRPRRETQKNASTAEELYAIIQKKDELLAEKLTDLGRKQSCIYQLMSDLKRDTDARNKLINNIEKIKKEMETERKITIAKNKKIEHLENTLKEMENELSKQKTTILSIHAEKEQLQKRLEILQNAMADVGKVLTRTTADLEDNALTVSGQPFARKEVSIPPPQEMPKTSELTVGKDQSEMDKMLFSLLSDSSRESELAVEPATAIIPPQVTGHFGAMTSGERVSPLTFKRKNSAPLPTQGSEPVSGTPPSLSQQPQVKTRRTIFKTKRLRPDHTTKKA